TPSRLRAVKLEGRALRRRPHFGKVEVGEGGGKMEVGPTVGPWPVTTRRVTPSPASALPKCGRRRSARPSSLAARKRGLGAGFDCRPLTCRRYLAVRSRIQLEIFSRTIGAIVSSISPYSASAPVVQVWNR